MGKARRPITASPLSPNHNAPRHPTGQIPEESTEAHQPRRDLNRTVHRIIGSVEAKVKNPFKVGSIVKASRKKDWTVLWDSGASEDVKSQAIKKVPGATALSPQVGCAAAAAAGEVLCDGDAVVDGDDSSDSSGDEDDTEPENEHVKHQKESWATIRKLTGQIVRAPWQKGSKKQD